MIPGCFGRPTTDGKTARGASSPAKPALHMPEPLSTTSACTSSSSPCERTSERSKAQCAKMREGRGGTVTYRGGKRAVCSVGGAPPLPHPPRAARTMVDRCGGSRLAVKDIKNTDLASSSLSSILHTDWLFFPIQKARFIWRLLLFALSLLLAGPRVAQI